MAGIAILELKESSGRRWQYSTNHTDGALRLLRVSPLLDKYNPTIVLDEFRDLQSGQSPSRPKYTAISHVWAQSSSVERTAKRVNRPLSILIEGDNTHTISWHGLVQAARASKHLQSEYMWLDFLCLHQTSKSDKKLQIKNMGAIYQNAVAALVMPGGVSAAQRVDKSAGWIDRAWTLQESTLCPNTYVLLDWPRKHSLTVGGIKDAEFKYLGHSIAVIRLLGLLEVRVSTEDIYYEIDGEEEEGLELDISCFGEDNTAIMALWTMLEARGDPYILKSAAWRSMWMRTSTKPQDMVFSVLHIFNADIEIDYNRSVDDLQLELAAKTADFPAWLYIGQGMPVNTRSQLLPALPTFVPNSTPVYKIDGNHIPVSSYIRSFDYISAFDVKVSSPQDMNGHSICGQIFEVRGHEDGEPGPSDQQFMDTYFPGDGTEDVDTSPVIPTVLHLASSTGEVKVASHVSGVVGTLAVILGETSPFRFREYQELAALSFGGPSLIFFYQTPANIWESCGSARLAKSLTETQRNHLDVGIPGGRLTVCTCAGHPRLSELKQLEAFEKPGRRKGFGYLIPGLDEDDDDGGNGLGLNDYVDEGIWRDDDEFYDSAGDGDPIFD